MNTIVGGDEGVIGWQQSAGTGVGKMNGAAEAGGDVAGRAAAGDGKGLGDAGVGVGGEVAEGDGGGLAGGLGDVVDEDAAGVGEEELGAVGVDGKSSSAHSVGGQSAAGEAEFFGPGIGVVGDDGGGAGAGG